MTNRRLVWMAMAAAIVVPGAVWAESVTGRITTINPTDKTFQLTTTNRETMTIDVVRVQSDQPLDEFTVGDKVTVEGSREGDGTLKASSVTSDDAGGGPPLAFGPATGPAVGDAGAAQATDAETMPTNSTGADAGAPPAASQQGNPKLE